MLFCLSAGATHCHNERYDAILLASTPSAERLRAYSWWQYVRGRLLSKRKHSQFAGHWLQKFISKSWHPCLACASIMPTWISRKNCIHILSVSDTLLSEMPELVPARLCALCLIFCSEDSVLLDYSNQNFLSIIRESNI